MDFHCLTRKELQFLCKRNKIPANITNVALADALKALEIVEGLDEFKNQSQSPEKTMNKASQEIPCTVTRTSTRRKTTKEEHQSTQSTIRTRKTTRRTMKLDEESKNLNVPESPVTANITSRRAQKTEPEVKDQSKTDLLETPLQSCRRRPGVGSNRRKVEAQKEGSLQLGYGTRRSVRLLEKGMAGLSIKESEKMEPVKVDEMVEGEVGRNNGQSGAKSELPLARNLSSSLEDERELKDDVEENSKYKNGESDGTLISEAGSSNVSPNGKNDEPEGEDKFADDPDGIIDPKGSDGNAVSEDSYEIVNLNEKLVADENNDVAVSQDAYEIENLNKKSVADETYDAAFSQDGYEIKNLNKKSVADETDDIAVSQGRYEIENLNEELVVDETRSIEVLVANDEYISEEILDHSPSAVMEAIDAVSVEEHAPQEIECQKLLGKAEEYADGQVSQNVSVLPEGHMDSSAKKGNEESDDDAFLGNSDIDDDTGSDSKSEGPRTMVDEEALVDDDDDDTGNEESDDDAFLGDLDVDYGTGSDSKYLAEDPMTKMVDEEALVDVNVAEAETIPVSSFHNASQSPVDEIPVQKTVNYGDSEALIDVCVKPAEEFAETAAKLMSPSRLASIPLEAQFSQPRKSSSKKQTTIPKVTQVLDNINKENIDNNSVKKELQPCLRKVKKNNNVIDEETMQNSKALIDVCVKPAEEFAETAAKLMSSSRLATIPLSSQFSQPRKSSSKKQTTIPKVIQVLDNINKEKIDNNCVKKELEPCRRKVKKNHNVIDEDTMQNLEGLSLRNLKKLTKKFNKLEITGNMKKKEDIEHRISDTHSV